MPPARANALSMQPPPAARDKPESAMGAALRVQLRLLRRGVRLHASKCSEAMRPLHEHMQTSFQKLELECAPLIEHA